MANKMIMAQAAPVRQMLLTAHVHLGDGNGLMITRRVVHEACEIIAEIHGYDFAAEMAYAVGDALVAKKVVDFDTLPRGVTAVPADEEPPADPAERVSTKPGPQTKWLEPAIWAGLGVITGLFMAGRR